MNFLDRAKELQTRVRINEANTLDSGEDNFSEEHARQAIVYGRQDTVLIVSLLNDLNRQVRRVTWLLAILVIAAFIIVANIP